MKKSTEGDSYMYIISLYVGLCRYIVVIESKIELDSKILG